MLNTAKALSDSATAEILSKSVTRDDVLSTGGAQGGAFGFLLPLFAFPQIALQLPQRLPAFWGWERDAVLRSTILHEGFWGAAIRIASTKAATQGFLVDGDGPQITARYQKMLLQWGGNGFTAGQEMGVQDFLSTDNGEFHEIIRATSAAGSRVLGVVHLDSWRCQRTGDPERPVIFRGLNGTLHELRDYQVLSMADMPSPGSGWYGVGHSAAADAYDHIVELHVWQRYKIEKMTGAGADKLSLVKGMSTKQITDILMTGKADQVGKSLVYYQGALLAGLLGDQTLDVKEIQLRGLPENFDAEKTLREALLSYADSIGMDPQELQPLSAQGLSGGTQSRVLAEKAKGRWPVRRNVKLAQLLNESFVPDSTTFYFTERDLADERLRADVEKVRADTRAVQIQSGEITVEQSRQLAVDSDDLPPEFLEVDETPETQLSDTDKPVQIAAANAAPDPNAPVADTSGGAALAASLRAALGLSAKAQKKSKSITTFGNDYLVDLSEAVTETLNGERSAASLKTFMRGLVREAAEPMYLEGMTESGVFDDRDEAREELSDSDKAAIADWIDAQYDSIAGLADDAAATRKLPSGDQRTSAQQGIITRVEYWADSFKGLGKLGKMSALADELCEWELGKTETHCTSEGDTVGCSQLDGKAHRLSWFTNKGYVPGTPGSMTTCGGFNCGCKLRSRKSGKVVIG